MARYYPRGSGNNRKRDDNPVTSPGIDEDVTLEENVFSEWLYGDYDETKLRQFALLHNVPGLSNYMDYLLDIRADQEYMERYGLDYSDIHDPRKLRSTESFGRFAVGGLNFISDNVKKLYR